MLHFMPWFWTNHKYIFEVGNSQQILHGMETATFTSITAMHKYLISLSISCTVIFNLIHVSVHLRILALIWVQSSRKEEYGKSLDPEGLKLYNSTIRMSDKYLSLIKIYLIFK